MTEAGWYADYEDPSRMRYHDGTSWTDHLHTPESSGDADDAGNAGDNNDAGETAAKELGLGAKIASFSVIGLFVGFVIGAFLFNGIGAITPTTELTGTVERLEIEYSNTPSSTSRRTHFLEGSTDDGQSWRIADEDAYNIVQSEGYPQQVIVAMGDWTDTAERVTGRSFEIDHQTTGSRIAWSLMLGAVLLGTLVGAFFIARAKSAGPVAAAVFLFVTLVPATWLGYIGVQWVQSG